MAYVGWPPAGPVPLQAFTATELDKSGWSLQSDTINLGAATATVMDGTTNEPVTVSTNLGAYGAKYAMGIAPNGWTSQAGHSYTVTIGGTTTPISYTVDVVDCSGTTTSACAASDGGAGTTTGSGGAGTTGSGGSGAGTTTGSGGSGTTTGGGGSGTTTGGGGSGTTSGVGGTSDTGGGGAPATAAPGCACSSGTSESEGAGWGPCLLLGVAMIARRRSAPPR